MFINPWVFYDSDDIPDLTPHNDEEMVGCLAGACGFIISTVIYVLLFYLCFTLTKGALRPILVMIDSIVIYPILMIYLMKLKERLAELLAERDLKNAVPTQRLSCFEDGPCTNPFHDCINCPRQTSDGSWTSTRITSITDIKENRE